MIEKTQPTILHLTAIDIALTFSRQFLAGIIQLALTVAVGRLLGPEGAGAYTLALLVPTILAQMNFGLSSASVYFVASQQYSAEHVWTVSRDFLTVVGTIGLVLGAVLVVGYGSRLFPGVAQEVLLIALCIYPLSLMAGIVLGLFQAQQDFRSFNLAMLAQPTSAMLGLIGLWLTGFVDLISLMRMVLVSHVFALAVALVLMSRSVRLLEPANGHKSYLRPAIAYGIKAHLSNIVTLLTYRIDLLMVNYFAGTAAAGLYSVAVRLCEQLWIFSEAFSIVLYPRLAAMAKDENARRALTPIMSRAVLGLTLVAAVVLALIAGPLIAALFGVQFVGATTAMLLLLPGVVLYSCARVLAHDLASRGQVGTNLGLATAALVVNTAGNILALPHYGIAGAAAAASVTYAFMLVAHLVIQRVRHDLSPLSLVVPTGADVSRLLSVSKRRFT